jgi:hypothetical protein
MKRETPAALSVSADTQPFLSGEPSYNLHDIMVKVTGLPSAGFVLKADSLTPVVLGDALTAAELAALTFAPTSLRSEETLPGNGLVIYVPQDCGRLPIPLFADLAASTAADTPVVITELPSNGSVFLADGMTAVVRGQAITAAQLCGLTFHPAADAVGQISLLRYRGSEEALTGEVLLVVGPAVPSFGARETAATGDDSSVSPIAIALLLEAGLSSLNATQASAAVGPDDLLPSDSSTPSDVKAGMAGQIPGEATGFVPEQSSGFRQPEAGAFVTEHHSDLDECPIVRHCKQCCFRNQSALGCGRNFRYAKWRAHPRSFGAVPRSHWKLIAQYTAFAK